MPYHVLFSTNLVRDLPYLAVAVRSLVASFSAPEKLHLHLLSMLKDSELCKLRQSIADLPCQFHHYPFDEDLVEKLEIEGFGYWTYLYFSRYLPKDMERLVYLDCDIVVLQDLAPLWELDLEGHAVAAVLDPGNHKHGCRESLASSAPGVGYEFSLGDSYFNSGFLLIDLALWNELRIMESVESWFENRLPQLRFHDQDAINLFLRGQIKALSPKWNLIETLFFYEHWDFELYAKLDDAKNYFEPAIRHFSGSQKPDTLWVRDSERLLYQSYLAQTVWRKRTSPPEALLRRVLSEVLELHYILTRGYCQKALRSPHQKLLGILRKAPYTPLLYPSIFLYRSFLALRKYWGRP